MPSEPVLHKGLILYAALNLEEVQETIRGLFRALTRIVGEVPMAERDANLIALESVTQLLGDVAANVNHPTAKAGGL